MKIGWMVVVLLIVLRFLSTRETFPEGIKLRITEKVTADPYRLGNIQNFRVKNLWVTLPGFPEINYDDTVVVEGIVNGENLKNAKLLKIEKSNSFLLSFREKILDFYRRTLPEPHAALVGGMVLGAKSSLPYDFNQALKNTGTSHVVVASGMNVSLVAGFLLSALILIMPRRKAVVYSLGGVWVYALLAGFDAPIIRASLMGSIAYLAVGLGRIGFAWRAFFAAAAGMLLIRPDWITDVGFLLSFAATAGIMLFEKRLSAWFSGLKWSKYVPGIVKNDLTTTLSAQVGVAPILFVTFGQFNFLSPFINVLILWTVPFITILGGVAAIIGLVVEPVGRLILYLVYPLTAYFIWVIESFS